MKYIKSFNESESIANICWMHGIRNYSINPDNSIDVYDYVDFSYRKLTKLPLTFNKVSGDFYCGGNELITLEGAPKYIGANFICSGNNLSSLEGMPKHVGVDFYCDNNNIMSLENYNSFVGGKFNFTNNPIEYIYDDYIKNIDNIESFNDFRIISGDNINMKRFLNYCNINGYPEPNIELLKRVGYIIK